jgi:hypothetical protein
MQTRISTDRLARKFCEIVSAEWASEKHIRRFLTEHPAFDIDTTATETGMRPVHYALQAGTLSSIKYLVEDLNANLAAAGLLTNFMLISHRSEVKKYIASKKLWNKLGNGTTDLHGYAWAGDFKSIKAELDKNPHRISELNNDNRSIFSFAAKPIKEHLFALAQKYCESFAADDHVNKRNYHFCVGHMELGQGNSELAANLFLHALKHHIQITPATEDDLNIESKIRRVLAEAYFRQLGKIEINKHKKTYADKVKKSLNAFSSIPNKIPNDITEYINYCAIFANAYVLSGISLYQVGDGLIEDSNYQKALNNYQRAEESFTLAMKLITEFPEYVCKQITSIEGAAQRIEDTIALIDKENQTLAPKLTFADSILGLPTIKEACPISSLDEKDEEEDKEEDEKIIPNTYLTSPSSLHGGLYHSRPLYHPVTASYITHPPPSPPDEKDTPALQHR